MNQQTVRLAATLVLYGLIIMLPVLAVIFSDRFRRQPSPGQYAALFGIGAAIGILLFLPAITIVAGSALLALSIARINGKYALTGVTFRRTLSPTRLFPGDEATLTIRLENRKLLPLAWLSIVDPIHFGLIRPGERLEDQIHFSGGVEMVDDLSYALINRTAVGPYQSVNRTFRVKALRRGVYGMGPVDVSTGDPFGIYRQEARMEKYLDLIVYPHVYRPDEIGLPFREVLGEVVTRRTLFEDPTLLAGSRDYRPDDPLNRMHWKATARTGALQVRVSDPSTTAQLMICVNLNTFPHIWQGVDLDRMDASIDIAASLALWALEKDFAVGLRSNGIVPGMEATPRIAASAHPRQPALVLEHLARLSFSGRFTAEEILADEARRLPAGGSIVFVTPIVTPKLVGVLTSRKLVGRVSVVYCGRFAAPVVRGVPIHLATPTEDRFRAVS